MLTSFLPVRLQGFFQVEAPVSCFWVSFRAPAQGLAGGTCLISSADYLLLGAEKHNTGPWTLSSLTNGETLAQ